VVLGCLLLSWKSFGDGFGLFTHRFATQADFMGSVNTTTSYSINNTPVSFSGG